MIKYYDKISKQDISREIVKKRIKAGMESTVMAYMPYKDLRALRLLAIEGVVKE